MILIFHELKFAEDLLFKATISSMEIDIPSDAVKAFFEDYMKKTDTAKDVIKLSLERLEINLRIRISS